MFSSLFGNGALLQEFRRLEQEMDDLLGRSSWPHGTLSAARGTFPPMNVGMTPDNVEVYLFAPGLSPNSIEVSAQQNVLTIAGEREPVAEGKATWYRKERFEGPFRRVISLPEDVTADDVQARYRDGVLYVSAKRPAAVKPRTIEINYEEVKS